MSWIISLLVAGMISAGTAAPIPAPQPQAVKANFTRVEKKQAAPTQDSRFDQTYQINPNGRVSLSNVNGKVDVEAWDKNEVRVEATKRIQCEKPEDIDIQIDANPNWVRVETEFSKNRNVIANRGDKNQKTWSNGYDNRCTEYSVDYKLTVPRTVQLDEIETVNGNVTLAGMSNIVKSSTVNGKVTARNLRGSVNITTVNGALDVGFDSLDNVREIKVNLVNGQVNLQLPSDVDAIVKASTVHGNINNDFNLPVKKGEYVSTNLYSKLGAGQIPIRLNSVNGTINIRRNQDGRSTRPAVNLLGQHDDADFDSDDYGTKVKPPKQPKPPKVRVRPNVVVNAPAPPVPPSESVYIDEKTRQEIRRAVAESKRAAQEAMRVDQEEIRRAVETARNSVPDIDIDLDIDVDVGLDAERDAAREFNSFALSRRQGGSVSVDGAPNLNVDARNSNSVRIRGWDKPEVSFGFVQQTGTSEFKPSLQKNGSEIRLIIPETVESYRLEIYVPRKSNVKVVSGGEIRVEGLKGKVELDGANGAIDVRDSSGNLKIGARNGRVRVIGFDGDASVKTTNGSIALEGNFTALSTNTIGGETVLTLSKDASATLEATTKNVVFDGIEPNGAAKDTRNSTVWKLGNGAANYKLRTTAGGQIFVRDASSVRVLRNTFNRTPLQALFG